jgi:ABC-2 type transport system ATP-binding protein
MPAAAIEVIDLRIVYGDLVAVGGVSFSASAGEVVALLGPNGAGKTSTIEALEGYRAPVSGRVRVLGHDPIAEHDALTPRIGVMLQEGGLYPGIRTAEALSLFASYYDDSEDPADLLVRIGLDGHAGTTARRLSGGQQQRLSLALALVGRPDVVFLDEPTAGLDVDGRRLVREIVREQRDRGVCVLLATRAGRRDPVRRRRRAGSRGTRSRARRARDRRIPRRVSGGDRTLPRRHRPARRLAGRRGPGPW